MKKDNLNNLVRSIGTAAVMAVAMGPLNAHAEAEDHAWDLRVSPLPLLIGMFDVEANIKLAENLTVGPAITYWNLAQTADVDGIKFTRLGVRANWHFNKAFANGGYISPFYYHQSATVTTTNIYGFQATGEASGEEFGALIGYQLNWGSVNMNLGIGAGVVTLGDVTVKDNQGHSETSSSSLKSATGLTWDLSVGYAF